MPRREIMELYRLVDTTEETRLVNFAPLRAVLLNGKVSILLGGFD